jgi:hypothetical protein
MLGVCAGQAFARTEAELRETISEVLEQQHPREGASWWRSLGSDAPKVMIAMYRETTHIYERMRLLHALGWFDDPSVVEFLKAEAKRTDESVIRNAIVRSVSNSAGARETEWVSEHLKHADADTRYAAAEALQSMKDEAASRRLERYLSEEKVGWIGEKLRRRSRERSGASEGENESSSRQDSGLKKAGSGLRSPASVNTPVKPDRLSTDLAGVWEGLRVLESASGELVTEKVALVLTAPATESESWKGEVRSAQPDAQRLFELRSILGRENRFRALLIAPGASAKSGVEVSADFEAFQTPTGRTLTVRAPTKGVHLIVRKRK